MTEHKDIQNPENYKPEDYAELERKLFSPLTASSELKDICMTLAHLPSKEAQEMLRIFGESERADEVEWLECAVDEGQFHYISPQNEEERRDFLALKVMQELENEIVDLEVKHDGLGLEFEKKDIEHEAVKILVEKGEIGPELDSALHACKIHTQTKMKDVADQISVKEKIFRQIKKSISTERYKNINLMDIRNIHMD